MSQVKIELALSKLKELLSNNSFNEADYQDFFENNTIVFQSMGFTEIYPQLHLKTKGGDHFIPDFILKRKDGLYEICDIKLPSEKIIKKKKNRNDLYSNIGSEYAGQLRNYANYFSNSQNKEYIIQHYGVSINSNPKKIMIVGRNKNLDRLLLHEILNSRGYEFTLITYDDIIEHLNYLLQTNFVSEEQYFGTSFLMIINLLKIKKNNNQFILDFGDNEHKNRFSIFIDKANNLFFQVIDSSGNQHNIVAYQNLNHFKFNEYFYLHCSLGCSKEYSIMEMYIDGKRLAKQEFQYNLYSSRGTNFNNRVFASDITRKKCSHLIFELIKCFNHNLNYNGRIKEDVEFFNRLLWVKKQKGLYTIIFGEKSYLTISDSYGQKSPIEPGLEGHWDIHNYYNKGKSVFEYRQELNQVYPNA